MAEDPKTTCQHLAWEGQEPRCGLGINVRELVGEPTSGWLYRLPCRFIELPTRGGVYVGSQALCDRFSPLERD